MLEREAVQGAGTPDGREQEAEQGTGVPDSQEQEAEQGSGTQEGPKPTTTLLPQPG
ncbi:Uncharacterized protein PODLI_1B008878, partial [Podarcis lilfordi]